MLLSFHSEDGQSEEFSGRWTKGRRRWIGPAFVAASILALVVVAVAQQLRAPAAEEEGLVVAALDADPAAGAAGKALSGADEGAVSATPGAAGSADAGAAPAAGTAQSPTPAPRVPVGPDEWPAERAALVARPESIRGIYLNAWAAGSPRKRARLIELANRTEINTFVIDVKEAGEVSYRTGIGLAKAIGADRSYIRNVRGVLEELRVQGIYAIARIVVFKDPVLAEARPEWAIQQADGSLWRDHHGNLWVDPYKREVWDYNIALAREAVMLGFSEIQWDYVRFPDVPARYMETAVYPARAGRSREAAIREFLQYSREQLTDLGVAVTADVFGLTVSVMNDMGIGQRWESMVDATDALLPMVYPSHFARGSYGIAVPNAQPYETVRKAMEHAIRRTVGVSGAAEIRPWLQDFSLGWPSYGPAEVRAQIQAVYDAGLEDWVLWNPGSRYTEGALAPEGGEPPYFPLPRHTRPAVADGDGLPVPAVVGPVAPKLLGEPLRLDSIRPDSVRSPRGRVPRSP